MASKKKAKSSAVAVEPDKAETSSDTKKTAAEASPAPATDKPQRETAHQIKLRHKKELQCAAKGLKGKGANSDKKAKEKEMKERHARELAEALAAPEEESGSEAGKAKADGDGKAKETKEDDEDEVSETAEKVGAVSLEWKMEQKAVSRATKRRDKKAKKDKERRREVEEEVKDRVDLKAVENEKLKKKLSPMGLTVKEIKADGHCLYRAIADQMDIRGKGNVQLQAPVYLSLRRSASEYMLAHADQFMVFMASEDGDGTMSDKQFKDYCAAIVAEDPVAWGGHPEIVALVNCLSRPVIVHSADGAPLTVSPDATKEAADSKSKGSSSSSSLPALQISFHKYYMGLGEHYNSVVSVV